MTYRKTAAFVDLNAIRANFALACDLAPQSQNIAVIKADAYGHGLVPVAEALQDVAPALAVAILDEALELRATGISTPLLVLEGVSEASAVKTAADNDLALMVHSEAQAAWLREARTDSPISVWLKVDTGMHRLGLEPARLRSVIDDLRDSAGVPTVVCTHLSSADETDNDATVRQLAAFSDCVDGLDLPLSIANSAGILAWPKSHADWNRPGYMLYGSSPLPEPLEAAAALRPAMTLRAEVIAIRQVAAGDSVGYGGCWTAEKPSTIATVEIGYADGYPRHAPNGTPTFINGRIAPLVGAVSMDMITLDLTGTDGAAVGDSVELWGENVPVNDVAAASGTIGYELITRVTSRVPRCY